MLKILKNVMTHNIFSFGSLAANKKDFLLAVSLPNVSNSSKKTKKIAKDLAEKILAKPAKKNSALVIGLTGDLGSGKTTFIQGFCKGVGIKKRITSPTFVIFKRYKIQDTRFKSIYHIDCYRIQKPKELLKLGFKEIINNPENTVLIEWAEKIRKFLPKNTIWIKFEHVRENERIIQVASH